jgi:hypothetical protein
MTEEIREQLLAVRDSGLTNMFDCRAVQIIAHEFGYYELEKYVRENIAAYAKFILTGEEE